MWPFKIRTRIVPAKSTVRTTPTPYDAGWIAAKAGQEFWENPHNSPGKLKDDPLRWFAGWCEGKRLKEKEAAPCSKKK